jgi:general secretion pathway protein D
VSRCHVVVIAALLLVGCASTGVLDEARRMIDAGQVEEGLARIARASAEAPTDAELRGALISQRELAAARLLAEAEVLRVAGGRAQAESTYRRVLTLAPGNPRAAEGLARLEAEARADKAVAVAEAALAKGDLVSADSIVQRTLFESPSHRGARALARRIGERKSDATTNSEPQLGSEFSKPISLEFREANLRQVFEIIARSHGINFVFDKDVRPDMRVTIFVRDMAVEDVVKLLLTTNQLARKVLNPNSILIYPNTPAKAREYQELVTRTFYLGNADAKQTLNLIRALVKTRDIFVDEKLNMLVLRDTPAAVRYAEKLIAAQDLAEPEVMLEVEVLEVGRSRLQELGVRFPDRVNFGPLGANGAAGPAQFELSSSALQATVLNPALILNLKQQDGRTNVLANPRIRVRNREKARIHIGEKVPVITTTSTANVGVSASVSYLETGLKLDVEPNVYLDDEIAIKVGLDVSNILETIDVSGTRAYRLGTRNAVTTLRLRDGETQILAGLIQDEDRQTASKLPGLGDMPVLGRLFSSNNDNITKTEVVLLITPRVLRNIARPEANLASYGSGTEAAVGADPLTLRSGRAGALKLSASGGPAAVQTPKPTVKPQGQPNVPSGPAAQLVLSGPPQAAAGSEITLQVSLGPGGESVRSASFEVTFDPAVLQPLGSDTTAAKTGRWPLTIDIREGRSVREVRFRVVALKALTTSIGLGSLSGQALNDGEVVIEGAGAHTLVVVDK